VTSSHAVRVASFEAGATAREMTNANARSRLRPAGPSRAGSPSCWATAHTATTCPCGTDRVIAMSVPASTNVFPASDLRNTSIDPAGRWDRFATVSLRTLPSSLNERRSRWVS
jgi:hypothetical protein